MRIWPPADLAAETSWLGEPLTEAELEGKREVLQQPKTHYEPNRRCLDSFLRANELFGDLPEVSLSDGAPGVGLSRQALFSGDRGGDQLTEAERTRFVGLEAHNVRLEGADLVFTLDLSDSLAGDVKASAYFFGYRSDKPFAARTYLGDVPLDSTEWRALSLPGDHS